jgi:hypothetical protein
VPKDQLVRIPLPPDEAVGDFLKVKPTDEMPRPGGRKGRPKKAAKKGRK